MIVSNLKLTIVMLGFYFSSYASDNTFYTAVYGVGVVFILVYPVCLGYLLTENQDILLQPKVKRKYDSVYDYIDTESK